MTSMNLSLRGLKKDALNLFNMGIDFSDNEEKVILYLSSIIESESDLKYLYSLNITECAKYWEVDSDAAIDIVTKGINDLSERVITVSVNRGRKSLPLFESYSNTKKGIDVHMSDDIKMCFLATSQKQ